MDYFYEDFTEDNYRRLLCIAKRSYEFIRVEEYRGDERANKRVNDCSIDRPRKVIINRHDIDASVHRAARLSAIEKEEGVVSIYFVYLHSTLYNVFEKEIVDLLKLIVDNGHDIGLHYEPWFYGIEKDMRDEFESRLIYEKQILEALLDVRIKAFSMHNPDKGGWTSFGDEKVCGLINMYSDYFKENYGYCSDSDGHWRYRRLEDVLTKAQESRLHILTHPAWWTPEVMLPRERIRRCAEGRMASSMQKHDENMHKMGRVNERNGL